MSLRTKISLYLVVLHLVFAGAVFATLRERSFWLILLEIVAIVSLATGLALAARLQRSFDVGDDAARLIGEGDFTARLLPPRDSDAHRLIDVYNAMVDTLRAERARLEEQHHFLAQIIGASPSGMLILDFDGRVSDVNPSGLRLLGLARADVVGRPVAALASRLADVLASLPPGGVEVVGLTGARRMRCQRGTFVDRGFPRTFYLIDELTGEARRIERAAYEKLIRVMSHEVNNSVTATNSLLESSLVYARELPTDSRADLEHALAIATARSTQLNQFMRRFADVYRLPVPMREPTDLRGLLRQMAMLTAARSADVIVRCDWNESAGAIVVDVDRGQFEQACLNILKNAVEAAGPGGHVRVDIESAGAVVTLVVEDSGPGPGPEAEAHLFTPFFSTKPQGQGIGLTLVGEILTAHGFGYALERGPDGPTRFVVRMAKGWESGSLGGDFPPS